MIAGEWFLGLLLGLSLSSAGQKPAEELPLPRETPRVSAAALYPVHPFFHADPYARVRLYALDRFGQLRPRVVHAPCGAYWPLTGEPYPFTPVRGIQ